MTADSDPAAVAAAVRRLAERRLAERREDEQQEEQDEEDEDEDGESMHLSGDDEEEEEEGMDVGSRVRLLADEARVRELQEGHGGWNSAMSACLGRLGTVTRKSQASDFFVDFAESDVVGHVFMWNPACFRLGD
jgi:hypothetical protein